MRRIRTRFVLALVAVAAATAAHGQAVGPAAPGRHPSMFAPGLQGAFRQHDERPRGGATTSVDRRLGSDGVVGSLGFLCGREPGADRWGAAAARGWDPTGRFVGARLRLTFR